MRDIKFKIIHDNKVIGYEVLKDTGWEWMCLYLNPDKGERWTSGVFPESLKYKRVQYAGLKDKNGKEIFEGDIIKSLYGESKGKEPFIGEVEYEAQAGQYWIRNRAKGTYSELCRSEQYGDENGIKLMSHEVIGNVYETPELLKT